jgi:molybdate transport system substrate-binding protein
MLVAAGEAAAGIVYQTDALAEPRVRVIGIFPGNSHSPIIYPVAVVRSSKNPKSLEFANYLQSTEARLIFEANGFRVLAEQ